LSDVKKFPQLFKGKIFYYKEHLNAKGAEIFTDMLVKHFLKKQEGLLNEK
jgi:hypothetical protein